MQKDFHYYACYAAAILAGYEHEDALKIAYSNQFTDECTVAFLGKLKGPKAAATTQSPAEILDARTDLIGLQSITRIWSSFHFLPYDLYAEVPGRPRRYREKYRLICNSNGPLLEDTVRLAYGRGVQATGLAMHILCDTWAHKYFAGTPSLVINNTNYYFYEIDDNNEEIQISFRHSVTSPDDPQSHKYTNSLYQGKENNLMNLGHGRAGHFPDYSYAKYKYMPAWDGYRVVIKDNPSDYMHAFAQMIYALKYLRGINAEFEKNRYDFESFSSIRERIEGIIKTRKIITCEEWKALGEELSHESIPDFDVNLYQQEYLGAQSEEEKENTFLGRYFLAALAQKNMVTNRIYSSGNRLAGSAADGRHGKNREQKDYSRLKGYLNEGKK